MDTYLGRVHVGDRKIKANKQGEEGRQTVGWWVGWKAGRTRGKFEPESNKNFGCNRAGG